MQRITLAPRAGYGSKVEALGLIWHSNGDYWSETAYWRFTAREVDLIETATNELHARCLDAVQYVIDNKLYGDIGIPPALIPLIEQSWEADAPSVYGRFDFAFDGQGEPKMLEYNADTPTSLLEAAVVQWHWLEEVHPHRGQFNSIHEKLIETWAGLKPYLRGSRVTFTSMDDIEDGITVTYLADTAVQAGLEIDILPVEEIGYRDGVFVGQNDRPLEAIFKLYPWEYMAAEPFFEYVPQAQAQWIEPPWKLVASSKGLLAILWKLFPAHPNLLPAFLDGPNGMEHYVRKPLLSREGAGVELVNRLNGASYYEGPHVSQGLGRLAYANGKYAVIGSWIIGQEAAGIGIRESGGPITGNRSQFVPHLF